MCFNGLNKNSISKNHFKRKLTPFQKIIKLKEEEKALIDRKKEKINNIPKKLRKAIFSNGIEMFSNMPYIFKKNNLFNNSLLFQLQLNNKGLKNKRIKKNSFTYSNNSINKTYFLNDNKEKIKERNKTKISKVNNNFFFNNTAKDFFFLYDDKKNNNNRKEINNEYISSIVSSQNNSICNEENKDIFDINLKIQNKIPTLTQYNKKKTRNFLYNIFQDYNYFNKNKRKTSNVGVNTDSKEITNDISITKTKKKYSTNYVSLIYKTERNSCKYKNHFLTNLSNPLEN